MMQIRTYLDFSDISGIGVFAGENVKKGDVIWKLTKPFDLIISVKDYNKKYFKLMKINRRFLNKYSMNFGYNTLLFFCDNARFVNHSCHPNTEFISNKKSIATRNIKKGEEITEDYRTFTREDLKYLNEE